MDATQLIQFIPAVLAALKMFAPTAGPSGVGTILDVLEPIVPVVVKEFQDLTPIVTDILGTLKGAGPQPADWTRIKALEAQYDADFEAAAKAAGAP